MKFKWLLFTLIILFFGLPLSSVFAKEALLPARVAAYDGKSFKGFQNPEYLSYDQALREYLVKHIDTLLLGGAALAFVACGALLGRITRRESKGLSR